MLKRYIKYALFLLLLLSVQVVAAQGGTCPEFVFEILDSVSSNCEDIGRNEVCYGNVNLVTEFAEAEIADEFVEPSDIVDIANLQTIGGSALDTDDEEWGIALMTILANIPNTVPGQGVQFMLVGDASVVNEVSPEDIVEVEYIDVISTSAANLRTGPSTNFGIGGSVANGATMTAIGVNQARDWIQVLGEDNVKLWVANFLVRTDGDLSTLPVVSDDAIFSPMQSFSFTSGFGEVGCDDAPPDHILVNSPEGIEVSFTVNGVQFTVASRGVIWFSGENTMTVTTFEGNFVVDALGTPAAIPPGFQVDIELTEDENGNLVPALTPQNYRIYSRDLWKWYESQTNANELIDPVNFNLPPEPQVLEQDADNPVGPDGVALGEGDIQVTLTWNTLADMDVNVLAPNGEFVYWGEPTVPSGGNLDIDSNFPCGINPFQVENIFWPTGTAPNGTYTVEVYQFSNCAAGDAEWTLTIRTNGSMIQQHTGIGGSGTYRFNYTR